MYFFASTWYFNNKIWSRVFRASHGFVTSEHNNAVPVRTLRDYLQLIKDSTPSCIVFPNVVGNFEMKPSVIQLLPKFHRLDSENPYLHLKEFDEDCATL